MSNEIKPFVNGKVTYPDIMTKEFNGYDLATEQAYADSLPINFLVIDDWVYEKIKQGLSGNEIIDLFYKTSIPSRLESFLTDESMLKPFINKIDLEDVKESVKEFVCSLNDEEFIKCLNNIKFYFPESFNTGLSLGGDGVRASLGQVYRQTFNIKGSVNQEDFNNFLYVNTAHEVGHKIGKVLLKRGKKFASERFAEKFAQMYCNHAGLDYSLHRQLFEFEDNRRKEYGRAVGNVLAFMGMNPWATKKGEEQGFYKVLETCNGRYHTYSGSGQDDYLNIYSDEEMNELLSQN